MPTPQVLIVDDDVAVCTLMDALLKRHGYRCHFVHDGELAIRHLRTNEYAAIVLDLMLPGTFGFEVIRFLHAERPAMARRVVVVTAASAAMLRDFDHSTVHAVVRKPFEIDDFLNSVDACRAKFDAACTEH